MSDLVERLQRFGFWSVRHSHYEPVPLCQEAAAEVVSLRAQLASAQEKLTMVDGTLALERSGLGIDTHATMVELCRKFAARQIELEARLASARKALEEARDYIDLYAEPAQFSAHNLVARINVALTDEKST